MARAKNDPVARSPAVDNAAGEGETRRPENHRVPSGEGVLEIPARSLLRSLAVAILVGASPFVPASALADSRTVDFETGPPIGEPVTDQYLSVASVYWLREDPGFRPYRRIAGVPTQSGTVAADVGPDHCFPGEEDTPVDCEFVPSGTRARLSRLASRVTLYAGLFSAPSGSVGVTLRALNSGGGEVASSTTTIGVGITTQITVTRSEADIAGFELMAEGLGGIGAQLGFDDLTLEFPDDTCPGPTVLTPDGYRVSTAAGLAELLSDPAFQDQRVIIPKDVEWPMVDCLGNFLLPIPVNPGVELIGERGELGSRPILFTADMSDRGPLFMTAGDRVRIEGLHLRGPFLPKHRHEEAGIEAIQVFRDPPTGLGNIVIADNEIERFRNAVHVTSPIRVDTQKEYNAACAEVGCGHPQPGDAGLVRVERNYLHNQARVGGGYGVVVAGGAYARVTGNVFEYNNHSIAATGSAYSGYVARYNYTLEGALKKKNDNSADSWPHHFDVHGTGEPGHVGGPAGTYFDISFNTFRGEQRYGVFRTKTRAAFGLRGQPAKGAWFRNNVLVHDDFEEAVKLSAGEGILEQAGEAIGIGDPFDFRLTASGNRYDTGYSTEIAAGDFDGDGTSDVFTATGTGWFFSRGGVRPWEFMDGRDLRVRDLGFADVDNDDITDVVFRRANGRLGYLKRGSAPAVVLPSVPVPIGDVRFGDFDADGNTDVFYTKDGEWQVWYGPDGPKQRTQTSKAPISAMLFGDFDAVPGTDVTAVIGPRWSYSSAATQPWARLNAKRVGSFAKAVAADFDGNGLTDIAFGERTNWRYSPDGRLALKVLRGGSASASAPLRQLPIGHFDAGPGASVVSFPSERFLIWRGLGSGNSFGVLSTQHMR